MIPDIYSLDKLQKIDSEFKKLAPADNLLDKAVLLEDFISEIFSLKPEIDEIKQQKALQKKLSDFKFKFVQKVAYRSYGKEEITESFKDPALDKMPILQLIGHVLSLQDQEIAIKHIAYKIHFDPDHDIYRIPQKLDFDNLLGDTFRKKNGDFEAHYCIYCHKQGKDSCRTGMEGKTNPLGNELKGCPLDQKISEMNYLYAEGCIIAALAVAMIDNPLVAITGHRVCNDCMKACIFQKQEPVDIPCIETDMVQDVLSLPYGAEIYYLLTRWNPLDNFIIHENKPGSALIAGLGPAGFALSYYLLRNGIKVTALDGMDIKPLGEEYFKPIKDWKKLTKQYIHQGFGGVCEYGITDRWDKNNLLLIRFILERFKSFEIKPKTKLGKAISLDYAYHHYDHIALAIGAGRPIKPEIPNIDATGICSSFNYLMRKNMSEKPGKKHNMPIIILGAGLTAMDCAFEAAKYSTNVSIIYRKSIKESPAYRENHDELQVALDLGVNFIENTPLKSIETNAQGEVVSINDSIEAKEVIYAFSTHNNMIQGSSNYLDKISYLGDANPAYEGTVVNALASAKNMHQEIIARIEA